MLCQAGSLLRGRRMVLKMRMIDDAEQQDASLLISKRAAEGFEKDRNYKAGKNVGFFFMLRAARLVETQLV
jgi:hypothetical protein